MLSTRSLIGKGVMMASGAAERDARKRRAMDHRYGRISRRDLRTVPPLRCDVAGRRATDFACALEDRGRETMTPQAIHATIGAAIWSRRSRDSERRERPNSQSHVNTGVVS